MSLGVMMYSLEEITWEAFSVFRYGPLQELGLREQVVDTQRKTALLQKIEPEIEYNFMLINQGDNMAFLIQDAADTWNLSLMTAISVSVYSPLEATAPAVEQFTVKMLCAFAERWSIVVDNDEVGERSMLYTKEDLRKRRDAGQGIFS